MTISASHHFKVLDAARGLAALAVMLYHIQKYVFPEMRLESAPELLHHSYLAVDLFFLMSGLVIARAYEKSLRSNSMTLINFIFVRLIRLSPLYVLSLIVGYSYILIKSKLAGQPSDSGGLAALILNLAYCPQFFTSQSPIFPSNPAAWSLSLELWVNVLYGLLAVKLRTHVLVGMAIVWCVLLTAVTIQCGSLDMGSSVDTFFVGGALRILFSFTMGVVIFRKIEGRQFRVPAINPFVLLSALCMLMLTPFWTPDAYYELFCVFIAFPAFVSFACFAKPSKCEDSFALLGLISYPIYMLHNPIMAWFGGTWKLAIHQELSRYTLLAAPLLIGSILIVSYASAVFFDEPVRRRLTVAFRR